MAKNYKIIDDPKMMTADEIDKTYDGWWVYVVKSDITQHGKLIAGMPVVIGKSQFAGIKEGIYEKYEDKEYEKKLSYNLAHLDNFMGYLF